MTPELEKRLETLTEKVHQLLRQQARLKKEAERLQQELALCRQADEERQHQMAELEQRIAILKYAAGNLPEVEKKAFEKTINGYLRDLDKVIAYLSQ